MDGDTLITLQRGNKEICILLREGELLTLDNIADVWVYQEDSEKGRSFTNSQYEQFMKDTNVLM